MLKRALSLLVTLVAILIAIVWLKRPLVQQQEEPRPAEKTAITQQQPPAAIMETPPDLRQKSEASPNVEMAPSFEIAQVTASVSAAMKAKTEEPLYRVVGDGGYPAKVVDNKGNVVIEANPNFGIYGSSVSPNGERILVIGYPTSLIVEPAKNRRIALPSQPPGKDKLGFASWRWIDDDTLLGESGDELLNRKPGAEGEGNNVAQTRLYRYNIGGQKLTEILLPEGLGAKVFAVAEVSPSGDVHLIHDDANATRPADLGWFKVLQK